MAIEAKKAPRTLEDLDKRLDALLDLQQAAQVASIRARNYEEDLLSDLGMPPELRFCVRVNWSKLRRMRAPRG